MATAFGPILGGLLVGIAPWGWRLIFLINLPIAAAVIILSQRYIPETRDPMAHGRVDYAGAVAGLRRAGRVVYGLTEGPASGWTPVTIGLTAAGVVLLAAFVAVEGRHPNPLLPLRLFRSRQFTAANIVTLAVYAALAGGLFLLPVQLQLVAGFSPVAAGAATLPITVLMLLLSARFGRLSTRIGPRIPMTVGPILAGAAMAWLSLIGAGSTYLGAVLAPMAVRPRAVDDRRAADLDRARCGTAEPRRRRVGGEQRRRQGGRAARGRRAAVAGRPHAGGLRRPGAAVGGLPARRPDRRRRVCGGRRAGAR